MGVSIFGLTQRIFSLPAAERSITSFNYLMHIAACKASRQRLENKMPCKEQVSNAGVLPLAPCTMPSGGSCMAHSSCNALLESCSH